MRRILVFLSVFALVTSGLSSQESLEDENRITVVSIMGLKRTKPAIIEKSLQKFIGEDSRTLDLNEVYAALEGASILETKSVEILDNEEGNGKILAVTAREKWTIFPIPLVSVNSSGWSAGGVLADANAFGIRDMMMAMGVFGSGDITASLMYFHSPKSAGEFGWNMMGFFSLQENEITDQAGEQTLRRYNAMSVRPSAGLSYMFNEYLNAGFGLSYLNVMLQDTENPLNAPEKGIQGIAFSPNISLRHNTWDGFFLNEILMSLKYEYTFVIDGDDIQSFSLNAAFNHSIVPGFKLAAKSGMVFASSSESPFFESKPMAAAVNILPTSYATSSLASVSLGLEKYLFKFPFGAVSILAAYQAAYSYNDLLSHQVDHGPVAMLQMYFSRLAMPGMGLGAAYNVDKNVWQYAFNMGMTF